MCTECREISHDMQITASMGSPTDGGNMVILNYNSFIYLTGHNGHWFSKAEIWLTDLWIYHQFTNVQNISP